MYSSLQLTKKYLHYYVTAHNGKGHGMHSPFVFQFILQVLNNRAGSAPPADIERLRKALLQDSRCLLVEDYGAGSRQGGSHERTVSDLAKTALKPKKYAQLLYRLCRFYKPQTVLELGTSLGLTTAYLAKANPDARILTLEGSRAIAGIAAENFARLSVPSIEQHVGNFDDLLPSVLPQMPHLDLAYIDGNHRYQPTLRYFDQLLPAAHNDSIFIFDDIHWSAGMEKAWEAIRQHPSVRCTVDVFFLGFVFFRKEFREKQHFTVRF